MPIRPVLAVVAGVLIAAILALMASCGFSYVQGPASRPFNQFVVSRNGNVESELRAALKQYGGERRLQFDEEIFPSDTLGRHYLFYVKGRGIHVIARNKIYDGVPRPESHEGATNPHFEQNRATIFFYADRAPWASPVRSAPGEVEALLRRRGVFSVQRQAPLPSRNTENTGTRYSFPAQLSD